jgi:hypothetical protein
MLGFCLIFIAATPRSAGKADKMAGLAQSAKEAGKNNIAFISLLLLGKVDECIDLLIDSKRLPEAALFARTYKPSRVSEVTQLWKQVQATTNAKVAQSLADPAEYENLFPGFQDQLAAEAFFAYVCAMMGAKGANEQKRAHGVSHLLNIHCTGILVLAARLTTPLCALNVRHRQLSEVRVARPGGGG